jgi:hypothetical protein
MTWTDPEFETFICPTGEAVQIIKRDNVMRRGDGTIKARVQYRTLLCSKAPQGGVRVGLGDRQPWMCEGCNLVDR